MKYVCKDTEKQLKRIWTLANWYERQGHTDIEKSLRKQYKELHQEYIDKRYEMRDNYVLKGER